MLNRRLLINNVTRKNVRQFRWRGNMCHFLEQVTYLCFVLLLTSQGGLVGTCAITLITGSMPGTK